jgi:hypothetical protein
MPKVFHIINPVFEVDLPVLEEQARQLPVLAYVLEL